MILPLPSQDIWSICSEEYLATYKKEVENIQTSTLTDAELVNAVVDFKFHFKLFVEYTLKYMHFEEKLEPESKAILNYYKGQFNFNKSLNFEDDAKNNLDQHNKLMVDLFNVVCNSICQKYSSLELIKTKMSNLEP